MYTLTLTQEERKAFDWVGDRYAAGDIAKLLSSCLFKPQSGDDYWHGIGDVTFEVPEHVAWEIWGLTQTDDAPWPCFAPELAEKMQKFVDGIV